MNETPAKNVATPILNSVKIVITPATSAPNPKPDTKPETGSK